jgi:hypothetical protein
MRIDISTLSAELLEIMAPLFCELEELGKTEDPEGAHLDMEEFVDALGRLYDQVPHPQKHVIIQECMNEEAQPDSARPQSARSHRNKHQPDITFKVSFITLKGVYSLRSTRCLQR